MAKVETAPLVHKGGYRGKTKINWLDSSHTFSFGGFYDPHKMGFRSLRVINEDRVTPGAGFGAHSHRDMEIITYVIEGALAHKDSLGSGATIRPGDAQIMSAGTGITHSEFNASSTEYVHFLQIWVFPNREGVQPRYDQKHFPLDERCGKLQLLFDPEGREGAVKIFQDAQIYASILKEDEVVGYDLKRDRYGWIQVVHGAVHVLGEVLMAGDGIQIIGDQHLNISTPSSAEFLFFDFD
ncbi:MAG: pirin family protein [Phormidesmis sp.]